LPAPNTPLYVGIDLGTTNSVAVLFDGTNVAAVRNGQGSVLTPSVVRIDARGNVLVGARARRYLENDPANTRREFKRLMGTENTLDFPAAKITRRPEQLSAEVLSSLRRDIADQTGVLPNRAVISVPALFELHQTAATSDAARLAGFERIELIQEPVASAIAAGWTQEGADGPWLVYDLGGGTFDVSLLDTREGLLRVVGHDGDNFLGGRDFDRALTDVVLKNLAADGVVIDPANPAHAAALARLRFSVEEAKIELTRVDEAPLFVARLEVDGQHIDVDQMLTRTEFEALTEPLIDRSIAICRRVLAAHGIPEGGLRRVVLVGGPTVMPALRRKVHDALQAEFGAGLDPMTLVAQGAALFAGTVGLDGRPAPQTPAAAATGPKVWLQFPAMTSDETPFLVGKLLEPGEIRAIRLERCDGSWTSEDAALSADQAFSTMLSLSPRQVSKFNIFGVLNNGSCVPLQPANFSVTHGMTLGEPPLARSIGVALANNQVLQYFERGAPLPIRRTFSLRTAETVIPGREGHALKVPIVQGEFEQAHLCRLVGSLEIQGARLSAALPAGSEIELALELDRGGQLRASARVISTNQIFDEVALLVTQKMSLEELERGVSRLEARANVMSRNAFQANVAGNAAKLSSARMQLEQIRRNVTAFRGGDLDAGEQARRGVLEFDAMLADMEAEKAWPELQKSMEDRYAWALSWVAQYGSTAERAALDKAYQSGKQALVARQEREAQRQANLISQLGHSAYVRQPGAWEHLFEHAAARVSECTDIRRANELVAQGHKAMRERRTAELESIVQQLWKLLPIDRKEQQLGHGSALLRL
jgi:molecular chaperone DnaK